MSKASKLLDYQMANQSLSNTLNQDDQSNINMKPQNEKTRQLKTLEKEFQIRFKDYTEDTKNQIVWILVNILEYPSSIDAKIHHNANKLGLLDLKQQNNDEKFKKMQQSIEKDFCKDCGLAVQTNQIPLCTSFYEFPKVGIATYLFFQNIKNLSILIILMMIIYSDYFLYVNITEPSSSLTSTNYPKKLSFASTVQNLLTNDSLYQSMLIQGWLIVTTVVVWWVGLFIIKYIQIQHERMVDDQTITASDFSIMLENVPITYTKDLLQKDMNKYYDEIVAKQFLHSKQQLKSFTIHKFCKAVPFYYLDDESIKIKIVKLQIQLKQKRQKIVDIVEQVKQNGFFIESEASRKQLYSSYLKLCSQKRQLERQLKQLSKNFNYMQKQNIKTTIFVSFMHSESANVIDIANPQGFSSKLRYYLSCCKNAHYFHLNCEQGNQVVASRAPEPEDVIWENIGIPDCSIIQRKMLTYFITILLLGASFGIVYSFTILQRTYKNQILSILISLSITVINIIIGISIRRLTLYESDISSTNRQISLAFKSIFAQLLNSIIMPVVTNVYITSNIYQENGLVYDIFYLSITNSFLPPILKFIDIPYIIRKVTIWYYDRPYQKLALNQKQLNGIFQNSEFQLGVAYIYYIDLFYFTCFYVHVHPCIVVFTLIGYLLMYWAQKNSLISRSRRPTPSSALLNVAIGQLISFSPCVLSLGAFVWFNLIREDYHNFSSLTYLSHLAALGFSLLFFLIPFNLIFNAVCYIPDNEDIIYDQVHSKLTSQYNLLNPVTAEQTLGQIKNQRIIPPVLNQLKKYVDFQQEKQKIIKIIPKEEKKQSRRIQRNQRYKQVPRKSTNLTQQTILEEKSQSYIFNQSNENKPIANSFQRPRKVITKDTTGRPEKKKGILHEKSQGYDMKSLKIKQISPDNPYNQIKF